VVAQLEALQKELAASQAAHEQAKADIQAATKDHAHNLSEAEQVHLGKQNELAEEIKKVTAELEVRLSTLRMHKSHFVSAGSRGTVQFQGRSR